MKFWPGRQQQSEPASVPAASAPPAVPSATARLFAPFGKIWQALEWVFTALDEGLVCFAIPFGVRLRNPRHRFAVLLGVYALIYALASVTVPIVPLAALIFGYVGVLAVGRAWVVNEKVRTAIAKKLKDLDPDMMPDLRWTALVSALQLFILFPLLFMQVQRQFHLYQVHEGATFFDWMWFTVDKTYLRALPDWSILYGIHISSIELDATWGRHLVMLTRLTFDYLLLQGVLRLFAIRAVIQEAVAAVKADPEMAVRVGRRAIPALIEKLEDPDKGVRGAAANALTQLGESHAIHRAIGAS